MRKKGRILLLILLCALFLVSCGKQQEAETEKGELVKSETAGEKYPDSLFYFA
jgi:PBP1b-binding outer membrane lipoprotein LpoB